MFRKNVIKDPQLTAVASVAQEYEAIQIVDILAQHGIPAMHRDREDIGGYLRILGYGSPYGVDVYVNKDQAEEAKRILDEVLEPEEPISEEELAELAMQYAQENSEDDIGS